MELLNILALIFLGALVVYIINERRALYFPSTHRIVDTIAEFAQIKEGDVAVDLGAGDGRVCIELAQRGAECIGIERNPFLFWRATNKVAESGIQNRITIVKQNLNDYDLSEATVVVAFLSQTTTYPLKDKVLKETRPGTRIILVDHRFEDWEPEKMEIVQRIPVRLYIVPEES